MEETLYEKMLAVILDKEVRHSRIEQAKECNILAIQAQIDLLGKQKERVSKWRKETCSLCLFSDTATMQKNIKIETIDLFLLLINDEIQELENKLSEK